MAINASSAKVVEIAVSYDAAPSMEGLHWATVEIHYALQNLTPELSIRVPIECEGREHTDDCRRQALQGARALLTHACGSLEQPHLRKPDTRIRENVLEGLSQELGLTEPRTR